MKKILFALGVLSCSFSCYSQKQANIWYFGDHAGLDFNAVTPAPITNGQTYSPDSTPIEGTAILSDSTGALLLYTNGMKIWNRNQQVMLHGDSILSSFSSTQAALILPLPGSSRYYYVFTTDAYYIDSLKYGFRYSIVDMSLDQCNGDVMAGKKNIPLLGTVAEKLTAVKHANGVDYWIIVHKYYSDAFYSYHLSPLGIIDSVISHIGSRHPDIGAGQDIWRSVGCLKASPSGNKLAIVNGNAGANTIAECFDFDKNTGVVSNFVNLQTNLAAQSQYYGVSFSPDNSKLYISCWLNGLGIYQFNLNAGAGNADSVAASKKRITKNVNSNNWMMQLAKDGRIYVAESGISYVGRINNPNNLGINCNYVDSAVFLNGKICSAGLPNFVDSYDYSNGTNDCTVGINELKNPDYSSLNQNIPNPALDFTRIDYKLADENKHGDIVLYNLTGEEINRFKVDDSIGFIIISTNALPAGTYYYQLQTTGTNSAGKKLVVIK